MSAVFPPVFQYSQDNLQDYVECARRFQLRYLLRQQWPAPLAEPLHDAETELRLGDEFHRLVERHFLGLNVTPPAGLLSEWWRAFETHPPPDLPDAIRKPEAAYSIPLAGRRLVAKFDLLAIEPGKRVVIVDWKTTRHRPSRKILEARLQTAVYRYVAVEALAHDFGGSIPPEAIRLIYWFAAAPTQPESFDYDAAQHAATGAYLRELIAKIEQHTEPIWPLTDDLRKCEHCNYRSFCERGSHAAPLADPDQSGAMLTFDLADVPEIEL
ncbi:MAG: PD-(D/E)XK nuclease family protein [Aggregatilineales bacterium]